MDSAPCRRMRELLKQRDAPLAMANANFLFKVVTVTSMPANQSTIVHSKESVYTGGPLGHGDPNDRHIRKVEDAVFVAWIVRERSHRELCADSVKAFGECGAKQGIKAMFMCQPELREMNKCIKEAYKNKQFINECREIYIRDRSRYRSSGEGVKFVKKPYYVSTNKESSTNGT
ncbi:hypothetical protein GJ496_007691 [Pomphorhynchus laevis]|nr:hypothetical protein GJ496_007691 [Pomphorhynchus laevis]